MYVRFEKMLNCLFYLAEEEKDIYIDVLALVCHLATTLPPGTSLAKPFSYLGREWRKAVLVPPV
jgi:hypothetical protein